MDCEYSSTLFRDCCQSNAVRIQEPVVAALALTQSQIIKRWEPKLKVRVAGYFLQRMKTKWGSCNHRARHIRLNTELVEKPKDLVEYVVVHEMAHLMEPRHSDHFIAVLEQHYPTWREARAELNELPLAPEVWKE